MKRIEAEAVGRSYGNVAALRDVSFSIAEGEWVAVLGPSGSGKTTLLNLIACLDRPTSGRILIDGQDVSKLSRAELAVFRRETIGLVFQQYHLVAYLSALENVMLAQYLHSMVDKQEAMHALESVGLGDRSTHRPHQLSGGEQQRVCIARALINHPHIILADEPTGNLDAESADRVLALFHKLHDAGHTIVMVTHSEEIGALADRRLRLKHGTTAE